MRRFVACVTIAPVLALALGCEDPRVLKLDGRVQGSRAHVEEAYALAAKHPDLLDRIPCFCGCEAHGHKAVTSCFVRNRDKSGAVAAWDYHGADCALCVDVVRAAVEMQTKGRSLTEIRAVLETRYKHTGKITPTPAL